jgi:hypothetical protein
MYVSVVYLVLVNLLRLQVMVTVIEYWHIMLEVDIMVKYPLTV